MGLSVYSRPYKELRGLAIGLDEAGAFPLCGRYSRVHLESWAARKKTTYGNSGIGQFVLASDTC